MLRCSLALFKLILRFKITIMSSYNSADILEKSNESHPVDNSPVHHIERLRTRGGHEDDRSQPALPVVHRTFANPAPLGLLSFATGIFLISMFGVHARSVQTPNVMIAVLMFFGGVCQFISGIMEFVAGNTVRSNKANSSMIYSQSVSSVLPSSLHMAPSTCPTP